MVQNRALNCLTVSNLKLDNVFTDVFGKFSRSIINFIWDHPGEKFDVAPFVHRSCKHPIEEIQAHKKSIEEKIHRLVEPYSYQLSLLRTIPGFSADPMNAIIIIAEIGAEMSVFPSAKHLASWALLSPQRSEQL